MNMITKRKKKKQNCTWKTSKTATMKAATAVRKPPIIHLERRRRRRGGVAEANSIAGPLYIVIRSAPATDTIVPTHFARLLWTFKSNFSILINPTNSFPSFAFVLMISNSFKSPKSKVKNKVLKFYNFE